jgi:hypothetical protein
MYVLRKTKKILDQNAQSLGRELNQRHLEHGTGMNAIVRFLNSRIYAIGQWSSTWGRRTPGVNENILRGKI